MKKGEEEEIKVALTSYFLAFIRLTARQQMKNLNLSKNREMVYRETYNLKITKINLPFKSLICIPLLGSNLDIALLALER